MQVFLNVGFNFLKDSAQVLDFFSTQIGGISVLYICSISGLIFIFGLMVAHLVADW